LPRLVWVSFEHRQRTTVIRCTFKRRTRCSVPDFRTCWVNSWLVESTVDLLSQQLNCWVNNSTVESTTQQPDGIDSCTSSKIKQCLAHSSIPISYYLTNYMVYRLESQPAQNKNMDTRGSLRREQAARTAQMIWSSFFFSYFLSCLFFFLLNQ
jgi:hypothetical protein